MQGFPNGAPGSVSHYEALLPLERSLEATCHGQVGAAAALWAVVPDICRCASCM